MKSPEARVTVSGEVDKAAISSLVLLSKKGEILDSKGKINVVPDKFSIIDIDYRDTDLFKGRISVEVYLDQKSRKG